MPVPENSRVHYDEGISFEPPTNEQPHDVKNVADKWLLVAGILAVQASAAHGQEVSTDYVNYIEDEEIIVTFSDGPGNPKDWVGLYKQDMVAGEVDSLAWFYVNGSTTSGEGLTDGELVFPEGMAEEGIYEARFFENDGYILLAKAIFTVGDIGPTVQTDKSTYLPGNRSRSIFWSARVIHWIGWGSTGRTWSPVPSVAWCGFMSTEPRLVVKELNPEHLHLPMV